MAPQAECNGVGISLISLTVPNSANFFDVVGIFWSLIPYTLPAVLIFTFFFTRRLSALMFFVFGMIAAAVNEFIIKGIHEEDRPVKSCLSSGAFPSGHSVISGIYFVWFILETLVHPRWSMKKKALIILAVVVLIGPDGPARRIVNDHSWQQIWAGVIIGAVWGLLLFLFSQFILARYLEYIMNWKIVKIFGIKNDFRPNYEHSKNKGAKAPVYEPSAEYKKPSTGLFYATHAIIIFMNLALGVIGLVLGFVKMDRDPGCDTAAPGVVISIGGMMLGLALLQIIVTYLISRKLSEKSWWPEGVQALLLFCGLLQFESLFWNVATIQTSDEQSCGGTDVAFAYGVLWFVVTLVELVFESIMAKVLGLRRLYGFKKTLVRDNANIGTQDPKLAENAKMAAEKPNATATIPPA